MTTATKTITARIPEQVYAWLAQEAKRLGNCSKGARVRYHLQRAMEASQAEAEPPTGENTPEPTTIC